MPNSFTIINGKEISQEEVMDMVNKIIDIFDKKNITHAIAYMILDEVKNELQNTIVKKDV